MKFEGRAAFQGHDFKHGRDGTICNLVLLGVFVETELLRLSFICLKMFGLLFFDSEPCLGNEESHLELASCGFGPNSYALSCKERISHDPCQLVLHAVYEE